MRHVVYYGFRIQGYAQNTAGGKKKKKPHGDIGYSQLGLRLIANEG